MKANAPEILYLHPTAKGEVGASWLAFSLTDKDIEYTRTDAFIEKAKKWFEKSEYFDFNGIRRYGKDDFEDFEKYMKNE